METPKLKDTLEKLAELKFPYETEETCKDKFTLDLRNGVIKMLRDAYILGACDMLKGHPTEKKQ